ncbi:aspartyl-phosphate phosphatase Spo0E family protein [Clostridium sp.]
MVEQMELVRSKLEKLITISGSLIDSEVVSLSQELDKLIFQYYLYEV